MVMKSPNLESYTTHTYISITKYWLFPLCQILCYILEILKINKHNIHSQDVHSQMDMTDLCETLLQDRIKQVLNPFPGSTEAGAMNSLCACDHNSLTSYCVYLASVRHADISRHLFHRNLKIAFHLVTTEHIMTWSVFSSDQLTSYSWLCSVQRVLVDRGEVDYLVSTLKCPQARQFRVKSPPGRPLENNNLITVELPLIYSEKEPTVSWNR